MVDHPFQFFKKAPDAREVAVKIFFEKYEQWAISEYQFLQVPAAFKPETPLTHEQMNLMGEFDILTLEAHKNLVDLQNHVEKMKRDGHLVKAAEWLWWKNNSPVASFAPNLGLSKPIPVEIVARLDEANKKNQVEPSLCLVAPPTYRSGKITEAG